MSKPPPTPPHSDIDGVNEDKKSNVEVAHEAGQSAADLDRARKLSKGRPDHMGDPGSADDRSR